MNFLLTVIITKQDLIMLLDTVYINIFVSSIENALWDKLRLLCILQCFWNSTEIHHNDSPFGFMIGYPNSYFTVPRVENNVPMQSGFHPIVNDQIHNDLFGVLKLLATVDDFSALSISHDFLNRIL